MQTGWDLGLGLEFKFTSHLSGFVEVRNYHWGAKSFSDYNYVNNRIFQTLDTVGIGLTYSFGALGFGASY
ncbi:MAG TPA: hypothetical protein VJY34_27295 [Roseiarcus sp.]|nr:hypothetical protein [Roseiarcus sp.]